METKLLVELIVIIVALAAIIWWVSTNYFHVTTGLFDFLGNIPLFSRGG